MAQNNPTLIKDSALDISSFKEFFDQIKWLRVPRTLGLDHAQFFYLGSYEDSEKRVKITLRPSMYMAVEETLKNRTKTGEAPVDSYRGTLYDYGSSVEVKIDDSMLEKIKSIAKEQPATSPQKLTWD